MGLKRKIKQRKAYKKIKKEREEEARKKAADTLRLMKERLTVHMIDVDRITPAAGEHDRRAAAPALIESIRRYGLIEPLTVRRVCGEESPLGGLYTLISGSRRLDALKRMGHTRVPCFIYDLPADAIGCARYECLTTAEKPDVFLRAALLKTLIDPQRIGAADEEKLHETRAKLKALLNCLLLTGAERKACINIHMPDELIELIAALPSPEDRTRAAAECSACLGYIYSAQKDALEMKRGFTQDLLPIVNSLLRITAQIRTAGYAATLTRVETEENYVLTLTVPKQSVRRLKLTGAEQNAG